jgi:hypothetical protein
MVPGLSVDQEKVLLTWENGACLRSHSVQGEEHFPGEAYRLVAGAAGQR